MHLLELVGPDEEPPAEQGYHGEDDSQPVTLVATGPAARELFRRRVGRRG